MKYLEFSEALENPEKEFDYSCYITPNVEPNCFAPHELLGDANLSIKYHCDYDEKLHLEGYIRVPFKFVCDRCGSTFEKNLFLNLSETISPRLDEDSELTYNLPKLDIDDFVTTFLISSFPSKVLCRDDCKGLCTKCGANLNEGECGCDRGN